MRIYENARNEIFRERADKSRNVVRINRSVKRYYGNVKIARYICIGRFLRLQLEKPIELRLLRLRYQYFHRSRDTFGILSTVSHYIGRMLYIPLVDFSSWTQQTFRVAVDFARLNLSRKPDRRRQSANYSRS